MTAGNPSQEERLERRQLLYVLLAVFVLIAAVFSATSLALRGRPSYLNSTLLASSKADYHAERLGPVFEPLDRTILEEIEADDRALQPTPTRPAAGAAWSLPTVTPSPTASATATSTAMPSPTAAPTTPRPSRTPTASPSPTATDLPPSASPYPTATRVQLIVPVPTATPTPSPSATATPIPTATWEPRPTTPPTVTPVPSTATPVPPTATGVPPTATASATASPSASATAAPTQTPSSTATATATSTNMPTVAPSATPSATNTATATAAPSPTATATSTAAATFTPTATSEPQPLTPVLECVRDNGDGTYTAFFGYLNPNSNPITIPVGGNNRFTPPPESRGQPTTFQPGAVSSVFSIDFTGAHAWHLDGNTALANASGAACP